MPLKAPSAEQVSAMEGRKWEEMETDCLVNIFRQLNLDDLVLGVPFVCKSWSGAYHSPLCWRVINFGELDFMPWSLSAKRFKAQYHSSHFSFKDFMRFVLGRSLGSTVELRFPLRYRVSWEDLDYAIDKCPRLKVLVCPRLLSEGEEQIPESIAKLKDLVQLEMIEKPSWLPKLVRQISLSCKSFHSLTMSGAINEADAWAMVEFLPEIKNLDLSNSYIPMEQLLVVLNGCQKLERFSVKSCIGFEADEAILQRSLGIKMFEHEGSKVRDESGYKTDDSDPLYVRFL